MDKSIQKIKINKISKIKRQTVEYTAVFRNYLEIISVKQKSFDIMHLCVVPTRLIPLSRRFLKRLRKTC